MIVLMTTIAFGATRPNVGNPPGPAVSASPQRSGLFTPAGSPPALAPAPAQAELDAEVARIEDKYGVLIGITISGGQPVRVTQETWRGGTHGGPAFGTIDVAMALACGRGQAALRPRLPVQPGARRQLAPRRTPWAFLEREDASGRPQALRRFGDGALSCRPPPPNPSRYLDTEWSLEGAVAARRGHAV